MKHEIAIVGARNDDAFPIQHRMGMGLLRNRLLQFNRLWSLRRWLPSVISRLAVRNSSSRCVFRCYQVADDVRFFVAPWPGSTR